MGYFPIHAGRLPQKCQTNTYLEISQCLHDASSRSGNSGSVQLNKSKVILPIGRAAHVAFQLDAMRAECCAAAQLLISATPVNEAELEECARLDDALDEAQRLLKSTVADVMISRLKRRSRTN